MKVIRTTVSQTSHAARHLYSQQSLLVRSICCVYAVMAGDFSDLHSSRPKKAFSQPTKITQGHHLALFIGHIEPCGLASSP